MEDEPNVAFVGDLVFDGHHPYIADDHIFDWLNNLDRARDLLANITTIFPGHGESGSLGLIDAQERYLLTYIDLVRELSGGNSSLTEEAKKELTQRMEEFLPGGGLSFLIAQSADSIAAELARAERQIDEDSNHGNLKNWRNSQLNPIQSNLGNITI